MQIYNKNNLNRYGFASRSLLLTNTYNMRKSQHQVIIEQKLISGKSDNTNKDSTYDKNNRKQQK